MSFMPSRIVRCFEISSDLAAPREKVWARVITPEGVNDELSPVRMSFPKDAERLTNLPLGRGLFCSRLRLWGLVPIDWHWLGLEEIVDGFRFHERSRSLWLKEWIHQRSIAEIAGGCRLTDHIGWQSRLPGMNGPLGIVYRAVFQRRHRRLRATFGAAAQARDELH